MASVSKLDTHNPDRNLVKLEKYYIFTFWLWIEIYMYIRRKKGKKQLLQHIGVPKTV